MEAGSHGSAGSQHSACNDSSEPSCIPLNVQVHQSFRSLSSNLRVSTCTEMLTMTWSTPDSAFGAYSAVLQMSSRATTLVHELLEDFVMKWLAQFWSSTGGMVTAGGLMAAEQGN